MSPQLSPAVPPKKKGRRQAKTSTAPLSGLDVDALLGRERPQQPSISAENAVPEFKQRLAAACELETIVDSSRQLAAIIRDCYITPSLGDSGYERAIEAIRVMRDELVEMDEPGLFNDFMRQLKTSLLAGKLGGDRTELWWRLRQAGLGLVDSRLSERADVSEAEAREVSL